MSCAEVPARPMQAPEARFFRPELDGLRFFAFLAVYVEHTVGFNSGGTHRHLPAWLGDLIGTIGIAGNFGVDLFFVLSSYLITELLLRERAVRGSLDVRAFYLRRVLRIWPLYFFVVAIAYVLAWCVPGEELTWKHVLGFALFAGNWTYFLIPVATVAGPLWSVSLEEQFYLAWPWIIRRFDARGIARCAVLLMAVAMLVRLAMGLWHPNEDWVTKNSFTRVDGIAVGALLATGLRGELPGIAVPLRACMLVACVLVLLAIARWFGLFDLPVGLVALAAGWPLAALACGGIILAVLGSPAWFTAPLRSCVFVYLGRISFGLYAYHELALRLGDALLPDHGASPLRWFGYWCFGLAATLPVAMASYRWLELPFLRLKRRRYTVVESRPD